MIENLGWVLLWGVLVGLDLASVVQSMITRPLVAGTVTGFILGDPVAGATVGTVLELFALEGFAPVGFGCLFLGFIIVCFIEFLKFSACRFEVHRLHKVPERVFHISFIYAAQVNVVYKVGRIIRPSFGNVEEFRIVPR